MGTTVMGVSDGGLGCLCVTCRWHWSASKNNHSLSRPLMYVVLHCLPASTLHSSNYEPHNERGSHSEKLILVL